MKRFRAAETAVAAAFAVLITAASSVPAEAEQRGPPKIDSFGPYKVGMPLADAKKADPNAKEGDCGDLAEDRRCLIVKAAVFEEPAVIYAVLDEKREKVDKVIAKLDPAQSRRRAYRCIRLSEKVFALLVVVYGSKYKQQYDANRRPLPAVAWDGELEGRLIFRANCKSQDEGTPLITVVPRRGEGSSVAADLSPTPTPDKGVESAADLLQGQKPGAKQAARSDAVSALAESAKRVEQQVRRTAPIIQEPPVQQAEPTDPIILGAGPGGLSIDSAPIVPQPAPSQAQIDIDDPSMLPRAAPRTPVDVTLLPDATPPASKPAQEPAAPPKPAVTPQTPPAVASKPAPAAATTTAPPTPKADPAPAPRPGTKVEGAPEPTATPPQTASAPQKPAAVARVSPNVPISRTTQARPVPLVRSPAADTEPVAGQAVYIDSDDDEGEQSEPVREMPVFAQTGTATSPAPPVDQANRAGAAAIQAPAAATPAPAQTPEPVPPRDPASQVASAAIPKSPKPAQPATGQPRSLIAARDTARPAADPTPRTRVAEKPKAVAAVAQPVRPSAPAPAQQPAEATVDLPDLDDEPTGTVAVSADRAPGPVTTPAPAPAVVPAPTQAPPAVVAVEPKPLEQRVASGQPRRLTRSAGTLPDRARIETPPPSSRRVTAVPLAPVQSKPPARSAGPAPVVSGQPETPATTRPAAPIPSQTATIQNRPAAAPARTQSVPSSAPPSHTTSDGVEDFGYDLDLRIERQKTRWKAPVPPVRPWRVFGTSSSTEGAVQVGAADTAVLDEPEVVIRAKDSVALAAEADTASGSIDGASKMAVPDEPVPVDGTDQGARHQTDAVRPTNGTDGDAGTAVLDEPGSMEDRVEEVVPPSKKVRPPKPSDEPTGTAAMDEPLVSFVTEKADPAPTSADVASAVRQAPAMNSSDNRAPVPPKRPWNTLSDAVVAAYITPPPVPAARPQAETAPEQKLAEQPDGPIVDTESSATNAPGIDSKPFGRRTDILDHL